MQYPVGTRIGKYTVVEVDGRKRELRCECGTERIRYVSSIRIQPSAMCLACSNAERKGKPRPNYIMSTDYPVGTKIGKYTVVDRYKGTVLMQCECGKHRTVHVSRLKAGEPTMCKNCEIKSRAGKPRGKYAVEAYDRFAVGTKHGWFTIYEAMRSASSHYVVGVECLCGRRSHMPVTYIRQNAHKVMKCASCAASMRYGGEQRAKDAAKDGRETRRDFSEEKLCECGRIIIGDKDWCAYCEMKHK